VHTAYLSLGSNLGDRLAHLTKALDLIKQIPANIVQLSSVYESIALGFKTDNDFFNICVKIETRLAAEKLLEECLKLESKLGRIRNQSGVYSSRTIDIDLISFDDMCTSSSFLTLPHPRFKERNFVLIPLTEIEPDFKDPLTQQHIFELKKNCLDQSKLKTIASSWYFNI
jgi:2-amino-4-hydroxy-6-hydroxymethyldihydropteridine diphosphokinase